MINRARKVNYNLILLANGLLALGLTAPVPAYGQTFYPVPQLAFTKQFGQADPLPQVLTIASTGADFSFSASASTSSGGSWLSIGPSGSGCCRTPEAIIVTVAAPVSLPAGTYTGQVNVTSYPSASVTMNIPVTLTVASGGAFFDNVPGGLSFSLKTGGAAPPYQLVQIRNKGTSSLSWTLAQSTADGGNWLSVGPASGVAPSQVAVSIVPGNLPGGGLTAGTFTGELAFTAPGSSFTIPIAVTVRDAVFSQLNPVNFTMPLAGANPLPQVLTVASTGSNFSFSVSAATAAGGAWLQVFPAGSGCCITPEAITVSITAPAGLAAGTYTGEIVFTQYPSRNMSMTVPVSLTVAPSSIPFLDNLSGQLAFSFQTGGIAPPAKLITIRNKGLGTLSWVALKSTADGGAWLNVSATQGNAPSTISVAVSPGSLPGGGLVAGNFVGQILIATATSSVSIPIVVEVGDSVFRQLDPLNFTMPFAGANPLPQILTVASTGSTLSFSVSAVTAGGGAWLQVSPSGSGCCATPEAITVSITAPAGLAAGSYAGEIIITRYSNRALSMTVPVTLNVLAAQPFLANLPGELSFSLKTGGAAPPFQLIQIQNAGTGTLGWSLSATTADGGNWLTASVTQGNAPSTVAVSVTPANLPNTGLVAGTFVGQINLLTATGGATIPVTVAVGDSVFSQVNPISFTMPLGGNNPLPQVLTIGSTGSNFSFSISASTATGGNWLQVSPAGNGCCSTSEAINVSITAPAGLAAGSYTGEIIFTRYPDRGLSMTVPVTLTVAAGQPFLDNLPGELNFSLKTGGAAPPFQLIRIRNAGPGTLGWKLVVSTADGGKWLGASITQGAAPSNVAVSIVPANLPGGGLVAGSFVGQLDILTASGSATIPVTVAVGDSLFSQVNPISFTMPAGGSNPLPQILTIASTGSALNFSISAATATGGAWLQVTPQGTGCCMTPEAITASVNAPAGLAAGTYSGEIIITRYSNRNLSMTVPVTLTVAPSGTAFLDNLPGELSFSLKPGGSAPPYQLVQIRNGGAGTLPWGLAKSTSDSSNWLNASAVQGTAPSTLAVSVNPANLPGGGLVAGTFVGQVLVLTAGSSTTIPISVVVGDPIFRQINPLNFTMPEGGANPLPQILAVASTGIDFSFSVGVATATGGDWLQVGPQGSGCCMTPDDLLISITAPAGLAAGSYTGEIIITSYSNRNLSLAVPVTLTVMPVTASFFDNLPGELSFFMSTGGGGPAAQTVQIRNGGASTLTWGSIKSASDGGNWIGISPTQGTAPAAVAVSINAANLPGGGLVPGTYTGQVLFAASGDSTTIPVSIVVGDPGFIATPASLSFSMPVGGINPLPQSLTVTSSGSPISFSASAFSAMGGNWLQISPQGSGCCATAKTITVSVNAPSSIAVGTYTGEITIIQYANGNKALTVPVYLTVE